MNIDDLIEMGMEAARAASCSSTSSRVLAGLPVVRPAVAEMITRDAVIVPASEYTKLTDRQLMHPVKDYHSAETIYHVGAMDGQVAMAKEGLKNATIGAGIGATGGVLADLLVSAINDEEPEPVKAATTGAVVGGLVGLGYTLYRVLS